MILVRGIGQSVAYLWGNDFYSYKEVFSTLSLFTKISLEDFPILINWVNTFSFLGHQENFFFISISFLNEIPKGAV